MKNLFFLALLLTGVYSCGDEPIAPADIDLSLTVDFGDSQVFMNGEPSDFEVQFFHDTINQQLLLDFVSFPTSSIENSLEFAYLPVSTGAYNVHEERVLYKGALTSFYQTINSESDGWRYRLINAEDGYFNIQKLDTVSQTIQGNFKVQFEVDEKNNFDGPKLPQNIKFEGSYYDSYTKG